MNSTRFHLFEVFGVELEYMIVDAETLDVRPICDELLKSVAGEYVSDVKRDDIAWSNELALHVVELKTNGPTHCLDHLAGRFQQEVDEIQSRLGSLRARLLPTAMHPWMAPDEEMRLWPHEYSPVYEAYNRIFDCRGHGWANLQSVHLNYPFANDDEFAALHAAIRLVLPLLPALAASSPVCDGRITGLADTRLDVYRTNSAKIPEVTGLVIPEPVTSQKEYEEQIFQPMYRAIAPFDPERLLQDEFLNARGAIARFDRGSIEIRLLDIQECPANDLAIAQSVTALVKALAENHWSALKDQLAFSTEKLAELFSRTTRDAERTIVSDGEYCRLFGIPQAEITAGEFWKVLIPQLELPDPPRTKMEELLELGTLSTRIRQSLSANPNRQELQQVYRTLADCLSRAETFQPLRAGE